MLDTTNRCGSGVFKVISRLANAPPSDYLVGTAFHIGRGLLMTARHNVLGAHVHGNAGVLNDYYRTREVQVIADDLTLDLAVVRWTAPPAGDYPVTLELAESEEFSLTEPVLFLGYWAPQMQSPPRTSETCLQRCTLQKSSHSNIPPSSH
jgi:hypothetical protein